MPDESGPRTILVVDDEPAVRTSIGDALTAHGFDVHTATDGARALDAIAHDRPDLVLLDVMLPRLDGVAVCRALRERGDRIPILMLTARAGTHERINGLDAGADDYVVKPFDLGELLARVRALLRRATDLTTTSAAAMAIADLTVDPETRQARRGDRTIQFTETEFALLELFLRNRGQALTRAVITDRVWGYDFGPASNPVEVYIRFLRRKLEAGGEPRLIHTVRGIGYQLQAR